jgi:hypothetical protein
VPNLRVFKAASFQTNSSSLYIEELEAFSRSTPLLETLVLPSFVNRRGDFTRSRNEDILATCLRRWQHLRVLSLNYSDITNRLLKALPETTPRLEDLSVAGCLRIGGAALVHFAKLRRDKETGERGLRRLNISGAAKVSEEDLFQLERFKLRETERCLNPLPQDHQELGQTAVKARGGARQREPATLDEDRDAASQLLHALFWIYVARCLLWTRSHLS